MEAGVSEYLKKLQPFAKIQLRYLKEEPVKGDIQRVLKKEADQIEKSIPKGSFVIVLDERGKSPSSIAFADFMEKQYQHDSSYTFIIGSSYGLAERIQRSASLRLSLSSMTMNHQVVRLVLLEQLYRMFTLQRGMNYHH